MATVVQTDFAWPDDSIERGVIEAAGHRLVTGTSVPGSPAEIEALVAANDPEAIMTCWAQVSAAAIHASSALKIVQRIGVGLDNIDVAAASARGAWVANVPDYCVNEVADHAVALLLDWARGTVMFDRQVKKGGWDPAGAQLRRVADLTVGIVGYGRIGRSTAARLHAFGCRLLAHSRGNIDDPRVQQAPLDGLLEGSDVVIIHAPLTPETHHLIDAARIDRMRRGAFLINVSRGPLVDSHALIEALQSGHLSGAGLDVVEGEPNPPRILVERPDVIATPHIAFSSGASLNELRRRSAEEVVRVLAGERPHHPCNDPKSSA
jgi:D-3-phosphoglycerate dehydrogenase